MFFTVPTLNKVFLLFLSYSYSYWPACVIMMVADVPVPYRHQDISNHPTDWTVTCVISSNVQITLQPLTHWGLVTHKCVSKLAIIGSDNGLSPGRRQAIIWTSAGILLIGPLGTNFSEILIEIYTFSFKKIHLKVSSGKWRPSCLRLNALKHFVWERPGGQHPISSFVGGGFVSSQQWHPVIVPRSIACLVLPTTGMILTVWHKQGFIVFMQNMWNRGPFDERFSHWNSKLMEISFCSHPSCNEVIAMKFYTWPDSCTVMTYTKISSNMIHSNGVTLKPIFHRIWITMKNSFMKWAPGPISIMSFWNWFH